MQAKFTEWNGKEVLEKDLPPGVRYSLLGKDSGWERVAADDGASVMALEADRPTFRVGTRKREAITVTILDWPDHCGPRPGGKVTYRDVVENAPSKDAFVVWSTGNGMQVNRVDGFKGNDTETMYHFLGYLELTD